MAWSGQATAAGAGQVERGVRPHRKSLLSSLAYGLYTVTLWVYDEGCKIVRPVVRAQARCSVVFSVGCKRGCVEGAHSGPAWRSERNVKPWDLRQGMRYLLDGEFVTRSWWTIADRLLLLSWTEIGPNADIAKRRKGRVVEASRPLDVFRAD